MFVSFKLAIISLFIAFTALCGDAIESKLDIPEMVAFVDNLTHALVASLSWLSVMLEKPLIIRNSSDIIKEVLLCGLFASLLDLDHFVSASSWKLADATHLKSRPFLHNTSLVLAIFIILLVFGHFWISSLAAIAWIFAAAAISHHIRDATRRGMWFWPLGSTPAIPYPLYIILLMIFPLLLSKMRIIFSTTAVSATVIELV